MRKILELCEMVEVKENRNTKVLDLNNSNYNHVENGFSFSEKYGVLCGSEEKILLEESLEILFENSEIKILDNNQKEIKMVQDETNYIVEIIMEDENIYIDFNTIRKVSNITHCDVCKKVFEQDVLVNIDMAQTEDIDDLKEEWENFDGMVCEDCYSKMIK